MTLGTVQMLLLAGLFFCTASGIAFSITAPRWIRWTSSWAPARRHRALVLLGITPLLLALTALLSVMLPSLLGLVWPGQDHCLVHDGHSHLCFVHSSHHVGTWFGWALIAVASAWLGTELTLGLRRLMRASSLVRDLSRLARYDSARGLWVMPTGEVLCASFGLVHPCLMISEGLLARAAPDELAIMLAHEQAHMRRKDTLVRMLVRAALIAFTPAARRSVLAALDLAAEQTCDEHAVACVGDRLRVAETILSLERYLNASADLRCSPLIASFGSSSVPERVEAMLQPARQTDAYARLASGLFGIIAIVLATHEPLHHATESLLAIFNH